MEETTGLLMSENARALLSVLAERVTGFTSQSAEETLAVEEPLEIQLGYGTAEGRAVKSISVTMRTPGYDCWLVFCGTTISTFITEPNTYLVAGPGMSKEPYEAKNQREFTTTPSLAF
jgi:hypothetical protein